jgi:hypothetical protein
LDDVRSKRARNLDTWDKDRALPTGALVDGVIEADMPRGFLASREESYGDFDLRAAVRSGSLPDSTAALLFRITNPKEPGDLENGYELKHPTTSGPDQDRAHRRPRQRREAVLVQYELRGKWTTIRNQRTRGPHMTAKLNGTLVAESRRYHVRAGGPVCRCRPLSGLGAILGDVQITGPIK